MVNVPHTTGLALTISIVNIAISVINTIPSPNPIVKEVHVDGFVRCACYKLFCIPTYMNLYVGIVCMINVPCTTGVALTISIVNIAISIINTITSPNPIYCKRGACKTGL
mgnify:FL=1